MSFIVAMKTYFGFKPGQTLMEFRDEVKELSAADKAELTTLLETELGEKIT